MRCGADVLQGAGKGAAGGAGGSAFWVDRDSDSGASGCLVCDDAGQNQSSKAVATALGAFKDEKAITAALEALSGDQRALLMQYLYRILQLCNDVTSALALRWHEKLVSLDGEGCIMRAISSRRSILDAPKSS